LIFDTGADYLVVETDLCPTCSGNVFKTSESTTLEDLAIDINNLDYRYAYIGYFYGQGTLLFDDVYLQYPQFGVDQFPFVGITEQVGISPDSDGFLGLGR
jgi:hypothetical protein